MSSVVSSQSSVAEKKTTDSLTPADCGRLFYVANRAHHADIGGATPGSMGIATDVYGEGVRIPPIRIMRAGEVCRRRDETDSRERPRQR